MNALTRILKKPTIKWAIFAGLFCFLIILVSPDRHEGIKVQQVPNPQQTYGGWVTDIANILSDNTEVQLNQMITTLEVKNGTEIAVVTVLETFSYPSPKAFTTELFNYWRIGKQGENNGVLMMISKGERRVEIEIGNGIAAILPKTKLQKIIDTKMIPQFEHNNFERGTLAGMQALIIAIDPSQASSLTKSEDTNNSGVQLLIAIGVLVLVLGAGVYIVYVLLLGMGIYSSGKDDDGSGSGSSSSDNSASSCGDSSGFGGGSSDGGGAGGSW